jgi:hypothetical protein
MPAAPDPKRNIVLPGPSHRVDHVLRLLSEHDHRRIVGEKQVVAVASPRVVDIARADDPTGQFDWP